MMDHRNRFYLPFPTGDVFALPSAGQGEGWVGGNELSAAGAVLNSS